MASYRTSMFVAFTIMVTLGGIHFPRSVGATSTTLTTTTTSSTASPTNSPTPTTSGAVQSTTPSNSTGSFAVTQTYNPLILLLSATVTLTAATGCMIRLGNI
ncbi:uncharacterized protein LOC125665614 [Ostrea edulis]|uniref:uncharacterized protein LOC125665614 n=1 Tax=Ostrea edulis TaxID=37623 RepID=UPI0024AF8C23|nr:uncharacterized protein LOC125665614 [Ostrea edulis]